MKKLIPKKVSPVVNVMENLIQSEASKNMTVEFTALYYILVINARNHLLVNQV